MKQTKKKRIPLVNGKYLCWTLLILLGEIALLVGAYLLGALDNVIGFIVLPFFGFFTVYTAYEAFVLALEGVSVSADGIVVAGKDAQGTAIHFEAGQLESIFPCDQKGNPLEEDKEKYESIGLAFRLQNGKMRIRQTSRLTKKQLARLREALGVSGASQE
ncbi:MAG: hypothetical protein IIW17_02440 [Clostridia bacterium]|jgi:hypothetical protein|nr:hypothetical protein [Clostridia bacterium]MBQ2255743.1 hypothetical protein [Clostridia bacterium]MBQ5363061.1 hypothetical protein [Clostridia bacterium]MBQ5792856.1 hypothetical protein [Clostridia bacterium]